ncbi:hypothetical protein [Cryptosporangium sp. NPDC051539]|uniref:hypothetical protein n=1 Tax=Cryptosporangium sp. NPDC051539 TaxID=3363962 RepID=UPI0037A90F23
MVWLTVAAAIISVGPPLLLAWLGIVREPDEWHWNDWVAQVSQIVTGLIFFGLAWFVGRSSENRSLVSANAELITSIGALSMSSARSYAGHDAQALRIAADARAALQHYPRADWREQQRLLASITDAYSDLTFGTFTRAQGLPRSIWDGLYVGAGDVLDDVEKLVERYPGKHPARAELEQMLDHICFVRNLGAAVRENGALQRTTAGPRPLTEIWQKPGGNGRYSPAERLMHLRRLYRRELTVVADWSVLEREPDAVVCGAVLRDIADSDTWLSPWYVVEENGHLEAVNVLHQPLGNRDVALTGSFDASARVNLFPRPLFHSILPAGFRTAAIQSHVDVLESSLPVTVCVLTYELICADGVRRRVVLDGNHRLAAARVIAERLSADGEPAVVRVLDFEICERKAIDTPAASELEELKDWKWNGFTPDIDNVRGAWQRSSVAVKS